MSATLFKYPHIYWRYLKRKVAVTGAEMLWLRRRSIWRSAVQQTIGWLPPPDFHMKYSKNTKSASVPRAVSLIDYSIFQIKLCSCFVFFFPPKPTSNHCPVVFMNRSYGEVRGAHFVKFRRRSWAVSRQHAICVKGTNYMSVCEWDSGSPPNNLVMTWGEGASTFISIHSLMLPDYH